MDKIGLLGSIYHIAAAGGKLNDLPAKELTTENLLKLDPYGNNVLHCAAKSGNLAQLPKKFMALEYLMLPSGGQDKDTTLHVAADKRILEQVPAELLTWQAWSCKNAVGNTVLHCVAKYGFELVPKDLITAGCFLDSNYKRETVLHAAAAHGTLDKLPEDLLSVENLLERDLSDRTVYHIAARDRNFNQIPKSSRLAGLEKMDVNGRTTIYWLLNRNHQDLLLGLEVPETVGRALGADWCARNRAVLDSAKTLVIDDPTPDVDLF